MICTFFVRRHEVLRLEVRAHEATREFALVIKAGDGKVQRDEFADAAALRQGLARVEHRLTEDHWVRAGMPLVIPDTIEP